MKKSAIVLLSITAACVCVTAGIFIGRNAIPNYYMRTYTGETNIQTHETNSQKININTASADDLMEVPGIGKTTADRIIQYRDENGNYNSVEDLLNVEGIGYGTLYKIHDWITTGG